MTIIFSPNGPNILNVIELNLRVKTHVETVTTVARSDRRKAHTRVIQTRLDNPILEGVLKFSTNFPLIPGKVYVDQNKVMYIAQSESIFINIDRHIGTAIYALPTMLIQVSTTNIQPRKQMSL